MNLTTKSIIAILIVLITCLLDIPRKLTHLFRAKLTHQS